MAVFISDAANPLMAAAKAQALHLPCALWKGAGRKHPCIFTRFINISLTRSIYLEKAQCIILLEAIGNRQKNRSHWGPASGLSAEVGPGWLNGFREPTQGASSPNPECCVSISCARCPCTLWEPSKCLVNCKLRNLNTRMPQGSAADSTGSVWKDILWWRLRDLRKSHAGGLGSSHVSGDV